MNLLVYVHMYIYISMYVYVDTYVHMYVCIYLYMYMYILYIANCLRRKSSADGQASSNLLENFHGLPTPLIFNRKCAHIHKKLYMHVRRPSLSTRKLLKTHWWISLK